MKQEFQQQTQQEGDFNIPSQSSGFRNKAIFGVIVLVVLLVVIAGVYLFSIKNHTSVNKKSNPVVFNKDVPQQLHKTSVNKKSNPVVFNKDVPGQFNDAELGISFNYPQKWGRVLKITSAHINEPFDLIHSFIFNINHSVSMKVKFLGEPKISREHADYFESLKEKANPRQEFCKVNLASDAPEDNENPNKKHSAFREFGVFSFGTCNKQNISFVEAKKVANPPDLVEQDQDFIGDPPQIQITKTYVIPIQNQLYSPIFLTIKLPAIQSNDYCLTKWSDKILKRFSCITYTDKKLIENTLTAFENSELNNEIQQLLASIKVSEIERQVAMDFAENYFKSKNSYSNNDLGIKFNYPAIFPTPTLGLNGKSINIDGFEIVRVISRQDAIDIEKSAAECKGLCSDPYITLSEWDLQSNMFQNNVIDKEKCKDCISFSTIGNNKYLVLFQEGTHYTSPNERYVIYRNDKRFEFNVFPNLFSAGTRFTFTEFDTMLKKSLMQKIVKDIIASVSFRE